MLKKKKKFRFRKKIVSNKDDEEIRKLTRKKTITERIKLANQIMEIKRPMFYLEAKEHYFKHGKVL